MRAPINLLPVVALLSLAAAPAVRAQADDTPELNVITTFPDNPFSQVKNGQRNSVVFSISYPPGSSAAYERLVTLEGATGAFLNKKKVEGQRGYVVRNMSTQAYKSLPIGKQALEVPFYFWPEFKPQDMGVEFRLLLKDTQNGKKHNVRAYAGSVQVVEPPTNWLDWQLMSMYALVASLFVGLVYWASKSYPGKSRTINKRRSGASSSKAGGASGSAAKTTSSAASAAGGGRGAGGKAGGAAYDDEWIPEQLKQAAAGGGKGKKRR